MHRPRRSADGRRCDETSANLPHQTGHQVAPSARPPSRGLLSYFRPFPPRTSTVKTCRTLADDVRASGTGRRVVHMRCTAGRDPMSVFFIPYTKPTATSDSPTGQLACRSSLILWTCTRPTAYLRTKNNPVDRLRSSLAGFLERLQKSLEPVFCQIG